MMGRGRRWVGVVPMYGYVLMYDTCSPLFNGEEVW